MRYFATEAEARKQSDTVWPLTRRGFDLGWTATGQPGHTLPDAAQIATRWQAADFVRLPGILMDHVADYEAAIRDALAIMQRVRNGESCADILSGEPYHSRLQPDFDLLAPIYNDADAQEIEKVVFDVVKSGELHAEDLWMKCSCLSFFERDQSIRFRFSYGMEIYKSHEGDLLRERLAAELADRVFPECKMVSEHPELNDLLAAALGFSPEYVEKIIFSNAPEGGAQFHQDVEKGHAGVLYGQLFGHTGWIALPRAELIQAAQHFIRNAPEIIEKHFSVEARGKLARLSENAAAFAELLEADDQQELELLLNGIPEFTKVLLDAGWGQILHPGDVMLLPQASTEQCCWHSVFCLDDKPGHALSFAFIDPSTTR